MVPAGSDGGCDQPGNSLCANESGCVRKGAARSTDRILATSVLYARIQFLRTSPCLFVWLVDVEVHESAERHLSGHPENPLQPLILKEEVRVRARFTDHHRFAEGTKA